MNFYPGRKVMFLKIKNKFRFVSISLLLASLVTVVSSASAEEEVLTFSITVEDCTVSDTPPTWNPTIATGDGITVQPGSSENMVTALTGFIDGSTTCGDDSMAVNGSLASDLLITPNDGDWWENSECLGGCVASEAEESVWGSYRVPAEVTGPYSGTLTLTWTPE
jgi:hypothetical protein